ncbi:MAG: tRNA glutamyl-Q(34) synthetase GluQRS [Phycisphaerae bacterium]
MENATTTRLAPSPTGALHLGNARSFLINYALARQNSWRILMRMEDLDGPRIADGADRQALDDLAWLGIEWKEGLVRQSGRHLVYQQALEQLIAMGMAYPCICSRKDIELAGGAPHAEDHVTVYPGLCRGRFASPAEADQFSDRGVAWRVHVTNEPIRYHDHVHGPQEYNLSKTCGDFVVFRSQGLAAYQLAVTVDDAAAGVDAVVRGDDLMESTARQIHLRRLLGLEPQPEYWHLPLVIGPDGRRLAKRHGDTRLSHYRERGVRPERIVGLLAYWSGAADTRTEMDTDTFVERFDLGLLSRDETMFTPEDDAFLLGK